VTTGVRLALAPQEEKAWVAGKRGNIERVVDCREHVAHRLESRMSIIDIR